jgi:hypothetical protein
MLWYNIVLVPYRILTYCWLSLNRLHTCPPIDKLKEDKGVAHARALPLSRGVASNTLRACSDVTCTSANRVVRWCGLVLPPRLAKEEEGIQAWLKRSYLRVSYHPLRCQLLVITSIDSPSRGKRASDALRCVHWAWVPPLGISPFLNWLISILFLHEHIYWVLVKLHTCTYLSSLFCY